MDDAEDQSSGGYDHERWHSLKQLMLQRYFESLDQAVQQSMIEIDKSLV